MSWRESRVRFWELLLLQVIAGIIGYAGFNACYVGALFSIPAQLTILACAYTERFPSQHVLSAEPAADTEQEEPPSIADKPSTK